MRDPARQTAEHVERLRVPERCFRFVAAGHVGDQQHVAACRHAGAVKVEHATAEMAGGTQRPTGGQLRGKEIRRRPGQRVGYRRERQSEHRPSARQADRFGESVAAKNQPVRGVEQRDAVAHVGDRLLEPGRLQRLASARLQQPRSLAGQARGAAAEQEHDWADGQQDRRGNLSFLAVEALDRSVA